LKWRFSCHISCTNKVSAECQEILEIPTNLSNFRGVLFKIHKKRVDEIKGINLKLSTFFRNINTKFWLKWESFSTQIKNEDACVDDISYWLIVYFPL
jgi:hypothetical protein